MKTADMTQTGGGVGMLKEEGMSAIVVTCQDINYIYILLNVI